MIDAVMPSMGMWAKDTTRKSCRVGNGRDQEWMEDARLTRPEGTGDSGGRGIVGEGRREMEVRHCSSFGSLSATEYWGNNIRRSGGKNWRGDVFI